MTKIHVKVKLADATWSLENNWQRLKAPGTRSFIKIMVLIEESGVPTVSFHITVKARYKIVRK